MCESLKEDLRLLVGLEGKHTETSLTAQGWWKEMGGDSGGRG